MEEIKNEMLAEVEVAGKNSFLAANEIVSVAGRVLNKRGSSHVDQIVEAARAIYRKYAAPIDIPGIPNIVEPLVDKAIEDAIVVAIHAIAKLLNADDDGPVIGG